VPARKQNHPKQASYDASSRWAFDWKHPVTILILSAFISTFGWTINRFVANKDNSNLRFEVQSVKQAIGLATPDQPSFDGKPVFCDTANFTLVLAHNGAGQLPVKIHNITFATETLKQEKGETPIHCALDILSEKPFGIEPIDTYELEFSELDRSGRYIVSGKPGDAHPVDPNNLLNIDKDNALSLKPNETQASYKVSVHTKADGLYRFWFTAEYDVDGERTSSTTPIFIAR
jgi:hypothetical protein